MTYSQTAKVGGWGGSCRNARRVTHLTAAERAAIRAGEEIRIQGAPAYMGITERRVIEIGGRFYARMPT